MSSTSPDDRADRPAPGEGPWASTEVKARERMAKKDAVLEAAVKLFNERGFRGTSLDDVARKLQVTKPTIYHYFKNKEEVLFACLELAIEQLHDAAERNLRGPGAACERLRVLMLTYAEFMTTELGMCLVRTDDHDMSPDGAKRFRALKRRIDGRVREVLKDGVADGSLRVVDVRVCAFALAAALNDVGRWFKASGPDSGTRIASLLVEQLMTGVAVAHPDPAGVERPSARTRSRPAVRRE